MAPALRCAFLLRCALSLCLAFAFGCERRALPPSARDPLAAIHWDDSAIDWTRPLPVTPTGGLAERGYVGSDACKRCHAKIAASYARHSMAKSGLRPLDSLDARWLAEIFDAGAKTPVRHARSGFSYRPVRDGNHYFIEESLLAADGTLLESSREPVTHTLSAGGYGVAFYARRANRLYHAPIDYYSKLHLWDLDPVAFGGNPRFAAPLRMFCISCHSDYPRRLAGSDEVFFDPLPRGIGCERCHGPGERHVETLRAEDIVNPARLTTSRQLDVCAQCHLSSLAGLRAGRHDFSYRPGERLDETRVNYLAEPARPDRVSLLAHPDRLVRSACFRGSRGKLTCTTCHDPHVSSFDEPAQYWDRKCEGCHREPERTCSAAPAVRAAAGDHCVGCHMRTGATGDVPLVSVTDHFIQRRPPPRSTRPDEKPDRLIAWSAFLGEPIAGDDLAAVEAAAYARAGRPDEATRLAAGAIERRARVPDLYEWLIGGMNERGDRHDVPRAYAAVLRFDPDSRASLVGYARSRLDENSVESAAQATHALDRLLAIDPQNPAALETEGILLFRRGEVERARPLFERGAAAPSAAACHVALAALALHAGKPREAIVDLEAARRGEPNDAWVLDELGRAYLAIDDRVHARELAHARQQLIAAHRPPKNTAASAWLPPAWR